MAIPVQDFYSLVCMDTIGNLDVLPQHPTTSTSEEISHTSTQSLSTTDILNVTANQCNRNSLIVVAINGGVTGTLIVPVVLLVARLVLLNRKYKRALNAAHQGSGRGEGSDTSTWLHIKQLD